MTIFWSAALSPESVVWSRATASLCLFCALLLSLARERAKREVRIGLLITLSPHHTVSGVPMPMFGMVCISLFLRTSYAVLANGFLRRA